MSIYAELTATIPLKVKIKNKVAIPKKQTLPELNKKLQELEQLCAKTGQVIPLVLKIVEDSVTGTAVIFSNEWGMKAGNPTNILALVQFALSTYYPDTDEEAKQLLLGKVEGALEQPKIPSFEVGKQKKKKQMNVETPNILDHAQVKNQVTQESIVNAPATSRSQSRSNFTMKTVAPWVLSYVGIMVLSVIFSVWTTGILISDTNATVATTVVAQTLPDTGAGGAISLPFTVHEEGQKEQQAIELTSYMQVDSLTAVKGTSTPNKTIVFKNKEGKEIGKTKTTDKGAFDVQLIQGETSE